MSKFRQVLRSVLFRPKGIPKDKPISRDKLGPPRSVKIKRGPNTPAETVILRQCQCTSCGRLFDSAGVSVLCPQCEAKWAFYGRVAEDMALGEGELPRGMARVKGTTEPVTGTGVRPKVRGEE